MRLILLVLMVMLSNLALQAQTDVRPNIVFIFIDDLNDYTQVFEGQPQSATPNIANLASEGTVFLNAFANSTKCMPSRHSMISGKDVAYTQVYKNMGCDPFRDFFTESKGNPWVYTFAEVLKDSAGYFTYGINKYEHCYKEFPDYDSISLDNCSRSLSWNKFFSIPNGESFEINTFASPLDEGEAGFSWYRIPDSMETQMIDYILVDSALDFIDAYEADPSLACDKPLFMMIGFRKPHMPWYIPEHYFMDDYISDFSAEPYPYPYNYPEQSYPYNGVVMPPQPEMKYGDYYAFPDTGLARAVSDDGNTHEKFEKAWKSLDELPEIDFFLPEEMRKAIVNDSYRANSLIAYLAAVQFIDAQVGRFIDSLKSNNPAFYSNTIFITTSDHGYSFGEKRTWKKGTMWESDIRVPFIINDMRAPLAQEVQDAVGLIDIFPTLMDMAESPLPMIDGTTPYLDGISLLPYLSNPDIHKQRGIVSGIKTLNVDCSCYPQYSVRTSRFHYIYYTSNNGEYATPACLPSERFHEEELYDIGTNRETDPNEWNNLATNEEYGPLLAFVRTFLPDSTNYQKVLYATELTVVNPSCIQSSTGAIRIKATLFDDTGAGISASSYSDYTFTWTNNLTDDTLTGLKLNFPVSSIDPTTFASNDHMLFYLHVSDNATGELIAFDMKKIFINPSSQPAIDFNLNAEDLKVLIEDVTLSGSYTDVFWETTSGYSGKGLPPTPLAVSEPGTYSVKGSVYYGNKSTCKKSTIKSISLLSPPLRLGMVDHFFRVMPNPADQQVMLEWDQETIPLQLFMYSVAGEMVYTTTHFSTTNLKLETGKLPPGLYTLTLVAEKGMQSTQMAIIH